MITAANFTDFLYRPRRPEELDTAAGGGVMFSQAPHQVDVVRLLGGGRVRGVRASTGAWDPARPTEGAYAAHLDFEDGAFGTLTYSGYAHFDTDELCGWIGETGKPRDPESYGTARAALARIASAAEEASLKNARAYGSGPAGRPSPERPRHHNHFGLLVASCEGADLRPTADGVMIYADAERRFEPVPLPEVPRAEVIDELYDAVVLGRPPLHDGAWGMATTEVCLAMLRSAREGREIALGHQSAVRP
jgi:phthalate 4,5-cis-dihydrodiol dehydrogenase